MDRRRKFKIDPAAAEAWRKKQAIERMMEGRFLDRLSALQMRTLLWRMRRYCDDGEVEKADVLAELLPGPIVRDFWEFYFDGEGHGPIRPFGFRRSPP